MYSPSPPVSRARNGATPVLPAGHPISDPPPKLTSLRSRRAQGRVPHLHRLQLVQIRAKLPGPSSCLPAAIGTSFPRTSTTTRTSCSPSPARLSSPDPQENCEDGVL
ncbi:unnamed protein product [Urochloa humidicola]